MKQKAKKLATKKKKKGKKGPSQTSVHKNMSAPSQPQKKVVTPKNLTNKKSAPTGKGKSDKQNFKRADTIAPALGLTSPTLATDASSKRRNTIAQNSDLHTKRSPKKSEKKLNEHLVVPIQEERHEDAQSRLGSNFGGDELDFAHAPSQMQSRQNLNMEEGPQEPQPVLEQQMDDLFSEKP